MALLSIGRAGLGLAEYPPARIKQSVAGHGRASKEQVQKMVYMLLGKLNPIVKMKVMRWQPLYVMYRW